MQRMALMLLCMALVALVPDALGMQGQGGCAGARSVVCAGGAVVLWRFQAVVGRGIAEASHSGPTCLAATSLRP